jgi:hypothetical protein
MDDLRGDIFYDYLRPWHFIDLPYAVGVPAETAMPAELNVLTQTRAMIETLQKSAGADDEKSLTEKSQSLAYLIHLVGDAHDPVHCVNRFTSRHPTGDFGGNLFFIKAERRSLHAYWDAAGGLFDFQTNNRALNSINAEVLSRIRDYSFKIMSNHPVSRTSWQEMDVAKWVDESYKIAKASVYQDIVEGGSPDSAYKKRTQRICAERLAQAGYRLAELLNGLYKDRISPPNTPTKTSLTGAPTKPLKHQPAKRP